MWPKTKGSQSCSDSTAGAHHCQCMKSLCLQPQRLL
ncbi:rCG49190 [Rattus norvegicus]|uniref:RCG49190 n=1 Tax=Rattus norvegicus TaxID=10116 RepID=A6IG62_RAT|nr:rCG49190 [Rattus norvegicus]